MFLPFYSAQLDSSNLVLDDGVSLAGVEAHAVTTADSVHKVESPAVIVTGASRGIGRAIALSLGKAGCKVCNRIHAYLALIWHYRLLDHIL